MRAVHLVDRASARAYASARQLTVSPHPFGGLTFVYEDVSDRLALECSYNTLIQVQRATLDHLFEGIAVYVSDGRLKLNNPAFQAM
jgi:hypothetical protein